MPTICELKIQAKAKGIKGYSGMNKAELMKLVEGGVSKPKASKKAPAPEKKKTTKATSANLNALYKAGKKKVLAIKYKPTAKPKTPKNFKKNYLDELPDVLIDKIKAEAVEEVPLDRFHRLLNDPKNARKLEIWETGIYDDLADRFFDSKKATKMSQERRDKYVDTIQEKAIVKGDILRIRIINRVFKKNKNKSDKEIVDLLINEEY